MRVAAAGAPSPSPRTTYYVPRTQGADTPVRPYEGIKRATRHEPQPQATSYKPLATVSSFQRGEPVQTGVPTGYAVP